MWEELAQCGVTPLRTVTEVDNAISAEGTTLVVVNSVCGCAAGAARPAVTRALQNDVIPDRLTTVFAGVDRAATQRVREYMSEVPPSSPSVALFENGKLLYVLERRHIEGRTVEAISILVKDAFRRHCSRKGPSVPREVYEKVVHAQRCGSQIPSFGG
jgi:putative YphP/YqiW family bacilliredoxin